MTGKHPLRCETCKHKGCRVYSDLSTTLHCEKYNLSIDVLLKRQIELVGCASHSDARSADDVLDELDAYAESCRSQNENEGKKEKNEIIVAAFAGAALAFEGMRVKIAELRKGGEG